ncbi:Alb1-domain-containing protein [Xylariaceae sp. FL0804]|nr:Alb1-domain-containing protein [Xylariaceae sp. FL0804]
MAKATVTKKRKAPSIHSRAARRATSPSINTDKSLKEVQAPAESVDYRPSVLSIHHGAGVSKKQKPGRPMSSKARKRHEKAQDRAAAILERTAQKVGKSKGQARSIQSRAKTWDAINSTVTSSKKESKEPPAEEGKKQESDSELDDEMLEAEDAGQVEAQPLTISTGNADNDDEIL